jgi:hypothetical protein
VDIAAWLQELGLERYETAFREVEIDAEILPEQTSDELTDSWRHHRRALAQFLGSDCRSCRACFGVASRTEHPCRGRTQSGVNVLPSS